MRRRDGSTTLADRREQRIQTAHPELGGLIFAVSEVPQPTRAWERGAVGEERLAQRLNTLTDKGTPIRQA